MFYDVDILVYDGNTGLPLKDVKVYVSWSSGAAPKVVDRMTDATGKASFVDDIPRGRGDYRVGFDKKGYSKCVIDAVFKGTGPYTIRPRKVYLY